MEEERKLQVRTRLPKFLSGHNFLIKVPKLEEESEEEGLSEVTDNKASEPHSVAMISDLCKDIEIGDEVIMKPYDFTNKARMAFTFEDADYFMYSQHDIQGVW